MMRIIDGLAMIAIIAMIVILLDMFLERIADRPVEPRDILQDAGQL